MKAINDIYVIFLKYGLEIEDIMVFSGSNCTEPFAMPYEGFYENRKYYPNKIDSRYVTIQEWLDQKDSHDRL